MQSSLDSQQTLVFLRMLQCSATRDPGQHARNRIRPSYRTGPYRFDDRGVIRFELNEMRESIDIAFRFHVRSKISCTAGQRVFGSMHSTHSSRKPPTLEEIWRQMPDRERTWYHRGTM